MIGCTLCAFIAVAFIRNSYLSVSQFRKQQYPVFTLYILNVSVFGVCKFDLSAIKITYYGRLTYYIITIDIK